MPEISDVFLSNDSYNSSSWESQFINISNVNVISFNVYSNVSANYGIRWAFDNTFFITSTQTETLKTNTGNELVTNIKGRYVQFFVNNILSIPCVLKLQAFFSQSYLDTQNTSTTSVNVENLTTSLYNHFIYVNKKL
jgi:hypothetical protein